MHSNDQSSDYLYRLARQYARGSLPTATVDDILLEEDGGMPDFEAILAALSGDAFLRRLEKSQLMSPANPAWPKGAANALSIAASLIRRQCITPWQAVRLAQGRYLGFFLKHYKLTAGIGNGVFRATNLNLMRTVIIKVASAATVANPELIEQWYAHVRRHAAIVHPSVARILDVDNEGAVHFLVRDYVSGVELRQFCEAVKPLPLQLSAALAAEVALALSHAEGRIVGMAGFDASDFVVCRDGVIKLLNAGRVGSRAPEHVLSNRGGAPRPALTAAHDGDCRTVDARDAVLVGQCLQFMLGTNRGARDASTLYAMRRPDEAVSVDGCQRLFDLAASFASGANDHDASTSSRAATALIDWLQRHGRLPTGN